MDIDFKLFLAIWNRQQGMRTPALHLRIAGWLEERWADGDTRLLLMAFRSAGKSTLVGLFAAWLVFRDPNVRILVLAADGALARKMVRNVKRIIERHVLTGDLKPARADQWAADRFTVRRDMELRDPSMLARGIGSNITGSRADIVICDDVEVPGTCDSAEKREDLRERLAEMAYVLVAGGTQLYIGTPHTYYSIYTDVARSEIGEERAFLEGFARLSLPIMGMDGTPAWPERYSAEGIEQIKIDTGPNKFESQMMLRPVNIMEGRLNPDLLQFYNAELEYARELGTLYIGPHKMVSASCWWDPAFGSAKGDNSVVAIVFADEGGNYYLHHVEYIAVEEGGEKDEASQQVEIVAALAKRFYIPCVSVEMNGIGRFLPRMLRNEIVRTNGAASVRAETSTKNKAVRIIEGFDAVMAAKRLFVHENVRKTPFIMEMREWVPGSSKGYDDGLDAVAGALSCEPDRLNSLFRQGLQNWMKGAGAHRAKSEFDV